MVFDPKKIADNAKNRMKNESNKKARGGHAKIKGLNKRVERKSANDIIAMVQNGEEISLRKRETSFDKASHPSPKPDAKPQQDPLCATALQPAYASCR